MTYAKPRMTVTYSIDQETAEMIRSEAKRLFLPLSEVAERVIQAGIEALQVKAGKSKGKPVKGKTCG